MVSTLFRRLLSVTLALSGLNGLGSQPAAARDDLWAKELCAVMYIVSEKGSKTWNTKKFCYGRETRNIPILYGDQNWEGYAKISVTPFVYGAKDDPTQSYMEICLKSQKPVTWWKGMKLFHKPGNTGKEGRAFFFPPKSNPWLVAESETYDDIVEPTCIKTSVGPKRESLGLAVNELPSEALTINRDMSYWIQLSKAKEFGIHKYIATWVVDPRYTAGKRVTITWTKD